MGKNGFGKFALGAAIGAGLGLLFAPKSGEEARKELKEAACELYEKHAPQIIEAKKQALESIDLMNYKIERQFRKLNNALKSKKMLKAKALEDITNSNDSEFDY